MQTQQRRGTLRGPSAGSEGTPAAGTTPAPGVAVRATLAPRRRCEPPRNTLKAAWWLAGHARQRRRGSGGSRR